MIIEILESAENDIIDGFWFYEKQQTGLGGYFLDSIYSDIDSLYIFAGIHSKHFKHFRLLSHHFPFAIYYKVLRKTVFVNAVLDSVFRKNHY